MKVLAPLSYDLRVLAGPTLDEMNDSLDFFDGRSLNVVGLHTSFKELSAYSKHSC